MRTPLKPLKTDFNVEDLENLYSEPEVREALFLASPLLLKEYEKSIKEDTFKKNDKLLFSLLKYAVRMHSRCTPFGLFSGCGIVDLSKNYTFIDKGSEHSRRLDMQFTCALVEDILTKTEIIQELKIFPNTSIYKLKNKLRFVEYNTVGSRRQYSLTSIDLNKILAKILHEAKGGTYIHTLTNVITQQYNDLTTEEVREFILTLLKEQVLITDLEPSMSGNEHLSEIIRIISTTSYGTGSKSALLDKLKKIESLLTKSDLPKNQLDDFHKIIDEIHTLGIPYEEGKLLQVDLFKNYQAIDPLTDGNHSEPNGEFSRAIAIINRLCPFNNNSNLDNFKQKFFSRFENQEIPLSLALDNESGIGYGRNSVSNFAKGDIPNENKSSTNKNEIIWNKLNSFLFEKVIHAKNSRSKIVYICEDDLTDFKEHWDDLPASIAFQYKHVGTKDGRGIIQIKHGIGSSAINLLGRFASGNSEILELVKTIEKFEREYYGENIVLAEIVHLPESRTGNVLLRPSIREFEIPYLSKSSVSPIKQIKIDDIFLSVRNKKLFLRSKTLNRQIVPMLGNAHNFTHGDLPIYHFLCDMQTLGLRRGLHFSWGDLQKIFKFFPRVQVGDHIILSPAIWILNSGDLKEIISDRNSPNLEASILKWREKFTIPETVLLTEGDNELLINLCDILSTKMFINTIKNKTNIILTEFIFDKQTAVVKDGKIPYTNEIIKILYKKKPLVPVPVIDERKLPRSKIQRSFIIGTEWLYYKIYCGISTAETILIEKLQPLANKLIEKGLILKWFFVRYNDPESHIRIRFQLSSLNHIGDVIQSFQNCLKDYLKHNLVWKVQTDTYVRELERYGSIAMPDVEQLFFIDSVLIVKLYREIENNEDGRLALCILIIDEILNGFEFTLTQKMNLMEAIKMSFYLEFEINKNLKIPIDSRYRDKKELIMNTLDHTNAVNKSLLKKVRLSGLKASLSYSNILRSSKAGLLGVKIEMIITSLIHMSMNRLFPVNQRLNELYIYDFLSRYYKSKLIIETNLMKNQ